MKLTDDELSYWKRRLEQVKPTSAIFMPCDELSRLIARLEDAESVRETLRNSYNEQCRELAEARKQIKFYEEQTTEHMRLERENAALKAEIEQIRDRVDDALECNETEQAFTSLRSIRKIIQEEP